MRLTTERKVCAGVLSLAAAALAVDRLLLGGAATGPALAAAAELVGAPGGPAEGADKGVLKGAGPGAATPVASQLKGLGAAGEFSDGFAPTQRWRRAVAEAEEAGKSKQPVVVADAGDTAAERFRRNQLIAVYRENGVPSKALLKVMDGSGKAATRLVKVGAEVDGYTLVGLETNRAAFQDESGAGTVDLEVAGTGKAR